MDGRRRDLIAAMIMHAPPLIEEYGRGTCPSFTLELGRAGGLLVLPIIDEGAASEVKVAELTFQD